MDMEGEFQALIDRHGGEIGPFQTLPASARRALSHYMTVDGDNADFAKNLLFRYMLIPAEDLKRLCWNAPMNEMRHEFADWESYHEDYWSIEDDAHYRTHLANMWPVILSEDEGVGDGWHRLHWYLRKGVTEIPAVHAVAID